MEDFWKKLPHPFFVLAPLADVTDPALRRLVAEYGKPDVMWTEFVSADGLFYTRGKKNTNNISIYGNDSENPLMRDLQFTKGEHPIVAQFFTSNPQTMEYASALALSLGFDGVDINMGCPDKSIEKQGAGAAHIQNPLQAKEVIRAAIKGTQGKIPVSVKTRIGYNTISYDTWFPEILTEDISALSIHLRTRKEMSKVPAHYELAEDIVKLCRSINPNVKLIANGDLTDIADAREKAETYGFDGMMLGRAVFGNPWLFSEDGGVGKTPEDKLEALHLLATYFTTLTPSKHYAILKKHFKAFVTGYDGAGELRAKLMNTNSLEQFEEVIKK
jgi:tRNA-dihydrouridine synthase